VNLLFAWESPAVESGGVAANKRSQAVILHQDLRCPRVQQGADPDRIEFPDSLVSSADYGK
jgi:hypothetical protein